MYCDKLLNIIKDPTSKNYNIDEFVVKKLDAFLKTRIGIRELNKLNPLTFSMLYEIEDNVSIMTFIQGTKVGLFQVRLYYNCYSCFECHEIENLVDPVYCECETISTPREYRSYVYMLFRLLFNPTDCDRNFKTEKKKPLDIIMEHLEKPGVSLMSIDRIIGKDAVDSLCHQRGVKFSNFAKGDISLESS
jgi:hypothetical protein